MWKIGITGGIGSGKTTVSKIFETLGVPVFYADEVAKTLMINDQQLIAGIKENFGSESYRSSGELNNTYLAGIVFHHKEKLERLNSLVHPAVFKAFERWAAQKEGTFPYVLKEAALLFESGSYRQCDKNILVISPMSLRMERVMRRDGTTAEQVKARINKQLTDEEKEKLADYLIRNHESESVIRQVLIMHQHLKDLSR